MNKKKPIKSKKDVVDRFGVSKKAIASKPVTRKSTKKPKQKGGG